MPNPFVRVNLHPSKTNVDRPEPIAPLPEHVEGQNFPYRGMYDHGVTPTEKPHDPDVYGVDVDSPDAHILGLEEPEKIPDPIPVRIVTEYKRELISFGTDRVTLDFTNANNAGGRPVEMLGRSETRTSVKITNLDPTNYVLIGHSREEIFMRGYPLAPGKDHTLTAEEPIFLMLVSPTLALPNAIGVVAYIAEYRIKEA